MPSVTRPASVTLKVRLIDALYPAHIALNQHGLITAIGPSLSRRAPWLKPGCPLDHAFQPATDRSLVDLPRLAANVSAFIITAREHPLTLAGSVMEVAEGYLLAVTYLPTPGNENLDETDFAPGCQLLPNLQLIRVQNALIEESRNLAAELRTERQRVVDVIERVGRMSGYLAHDLNNFLSVISLNAKRLLRMEMPDDRQRHRVNVIVETAERCSDFTQGMMTLANQKNDSRLPFAIDEALAEASALFRSACGTRIELRLSLEAGGAIVHAAVSGLINSIINLLINSRQAMPDGGVVILSTHIITAAEATSLRTSACGDAVAIRIADQGVGMPPDVLDRAFELFFSTKASGTGVGLASVRDFAEQMDGWVTLSSHEGNGTTMTIFLPLAEICAAPAGNAASGRAASSLRQRKVLVVDDEHYALEALAELLTDEDYSVTTARDAAEARTVLEQEAHDVLVTDVIMHGIDGINLARWASDRQPELGVILMSGFVPDAAQLRSDWLFIRKPIDPDMLCRMIETTLR